VKSRRHSLPALRDGRGKRKRGRFLVLEGIDGAGTTTQSGALEKALRARGEKVLVTAEPSGGPVGMLLRQALSGRLRGHGRPMDQTTLGLLFAADRADHVAQEIVPALEAGTTVICDRYVLSSIAYQGLDLDFEVVAEMNAHAPAPDLTLFLDVPPAVAQKRRAAARGREEIFDALQLQKRIDRNYRRAIAHGLHGERVVIVDGTLPLAEVTAELVSAVDAL
jgi:dTMP kinase